MTTLQVVIPDHVFARLQLQAADRGFSTAEELVVELIDGATTSSGNHRILSEDRPEELEAELVRRIESNDWFTMDEADFRSIEARITAKLQARQNA